MVNASRSTDTRTYITLQDIARYCGVGKSTVSHALSGDPRVNAQTRARILAAAERLGYDPTRHQAARRLAMRKYGQTVINQAVSFVSTPSNHLANYYSQLSQGVLDVLAAAGYAMVITPVLGNPMHSPISLPPLFSSGEIDGALLTSGSRPELQQIQHIPGFQGRPLVSLVQRLPGISCILSDDEAGAYLATRHLLELGHRHLLLFFDESWGEVFARRAAGVQRALREYGLDPFRHAMRSPMTVLGAISPPHHLNLDFLYEEEGATAYAREQRRALVAFLREQRQYTALLAQNDALARRLWYLLQEEGFALPEEISIVGFDDTDPIIDARGTNLLTSVRVPLREIGQAGAQLLLDRITGTQADDVERMLPTTISVRGSTAPVTR